jgi:hypothetical protein
MAMGAMEALEQGYLSVPEVTCDVKGNTYSNPPPAFGVDKNILLTDYFPGPGVDQC